MDLSYRSTISIYKVSADTRSCSCLCREDVWVDGEELVFARGSLEGRTAEGWIRSWAEVQQLLWAVFESRWLAGGEGCAGLKADPGRNGNRGGLDMERVSEG